MSDIEIRIGAGIALTLLLFFLGRTLVWWYFGIDRALELLASIDKSLKQLPAVQRSTYRKEA